MAPPKKKCSPEERARLDENARKRREHRLANPETTKAVQKKARKKFYSHSKQKVLDWNKEQRIEKHDAYLASVRKRRKARRLTDQEYVIKDRLRARLSSALKRKKAGKPSNTLNLVGCSVDQLHSHLKLKPGEVIDHIFPFELYDLHDEADLRNVMSWKNLQPLTPHENNSKSDQLPTKAMAAKVDPTCWPKDITVDMLPDCYKGWTTALRQ